MAKNKPVYSKETSIWYVIKLGVPIYMLVAMVAILIFSFDEGCACGSGGYGCPCPNPDIRDEIHQYQYVNGDCLRPSGGCIGGASMWLEACNEWKEATNRTDYCFK